MRDVYSCGIGANEEGQNERKREKERGMKE